MATSYSESDDDMEFFVAFLQNRHRRIRTIRDISNPFIEYRDEEFRMRFRLRKETVDNIMQRIGHMIQYNGNRPHQVSPLNQLLITMRFYAVGSFQVT